MSYPAYPEYKDSGVEWLGKVPVSWKICRIKNTAILNPSKKEVRSLPNDAVVSFIPMEAIGEQGELNLSQVKYISDVIDGYTYVAEGDVIIAKITPCFENGKGAIANNLTNGIGFATTEVIPIRPNRKSDANFLYYLLNSDPFKSMAEGSMYGAGGQKRVSDNFVAEYHCAYPSVNERETIATFLDRETQKIDRLIEKQQQLIKLLQEKRQAVISHAVTKGLNPDAKMKDSGVEGLGEIPEHWETRRIKILFKIRKRISGELGYDVLSITQQGIKVKDIESGEGQLSMDYSKYQRVKVGDFAMNHMDLLTGWVDISKYDGVTSPDYRVFSLVDSKSDAEYYLYVLQMGYNEKIFYAFGQGSSHLGRWRFPTENFKDFVFPYPPQEEQKEISNFIKSEHNKISGLIEKCSEAIDLMKERRTALISAAVTGKIDVRNIADNRASNRSKTELDQVAG